MEPVVTITFPLASIVIVLFLLWNDLLRRRRTIRVLLFARAGLCLALAGVLIFNWMTLGDRAANLPVFFVLFGAGIASIAAVWFFYRGLRGDSGFTPPADEPLPKIFTPEANDEAETDRTDVLR